MPGQADEAALTTSSFCSRRCCTSEGQCDDRATIGCCVLSVALLRAYLRNLMITALFEPTQQRAPTRLITNWPLLLRPLFYTACRICV